MSDQKITQDELIKISFIRFYLNQIKTDGPHKPVPKVIEMFEEPGFKDELTIDKLVASPLTPDGKPIPGTPADFKMDISTDKLNATNHYFTPMYSTNDTDTYTQAINTNPHSSIDNIPHELIDDLFLVQDKSSEIKNDYVILLSESVLALPDDELREKLIEIFKEATIVIYEDGEEIGGYVFKEEDAFTWDRETSTFTVTSPGVSGSIKVIEDNRPLVVEGNFLGVIKTFGAGSRGKA